VAERDGNYASERDVLPSSQSGIRFTDGDGFEDKEDLLSSAPPRDLL